MGLNFNKPTVNNTIPQLEPGTYPARIAAIFDIGEQLQTDYKTQQPKKEKNSDQDMVRQEVFVTFEFPTETIEDDEGNKLPRWLSRRYTVSMHEKSHLYALVKAVDPSLKTTSNGENPAAMLGLPLNVTVGLTKNKKPKISAVATLMKGVQVAPLANEPVLFDLDTATQEEFDELKPAFMREVIAGALNFAGTGLVLKEDAEESTEQGDQQGDSKDDHPDY